MSAAMRTGDDPALETIAERARRRAKDLGRPQLVVLRERLPRTDLLRRIDLAGGDGAFLFDGPGEVACAGHGELRRIEVSGPERFAHAAREAHALFDDLHLAGAPAPAHAGPLLVGGFGFANGPGSGFANGPGSGFANGPGSGFANGPGFGSAKTSGTDATWQGFPPGRLVLPRVLHVQDMEGEWCSVAASVDRDDDPTAVARELRRCLEGARLPHAPSARPGAGADAPLPSYSARADRSHGSFRTGVARSLAAIADGAFEKVVLARSVGIDSAGGFDPDDLLRSLRDGHPASTRFACAPSGAGGRVFLGATPERLVRLAGRHLETAALAGTAARGRDPEEDARLGRELLESKKEQAEHAVVVRALRAALDANDASPRMPEAPRLVRLDGIQHLETPITATAAPGEHVLDWVARLHPTPAVGGAPQQPALDWIARHEALDRGWYGGPLGWIDADGGGEFVVALRCAVLHGAHARLFAGAGIVAGSEPAAELAETRLKLRALLVPLLEL